MKRPYLMVSEKRWHLTTVPVGLAVALGALTLLPGHANLNLRWGLFTGAAGAWLAPQLIVRSRWVEPDSTLIYLAAVAGAMLPLLVMGVLS